MIPKADPPCDDAAAKPGAEPGLGADVGATLAKLAIRHRDGSLEFRRVPRSEVEALARAIVALHPDRIGLTGGGAAALARLLPPHAAIANEFDAWAAGARALLRREEDPPPDRFLLVSVGTGTSAILVSATDARRIGGTALGGGTVAGLAAALVGGSDFGALARLAQAGDRRRVDLLVADVYPSGELPLPGEVNAASFAKLAFAPTAAAAAPAPADLARAIMALVGENIALICGGLAAAAGVDRIVYGGTTLQDNPVIGDILRAFAPVHGCRASILADGAFTGALGALELAAAAAP